MTDREFLLMEAIRRLDAAYHQLWGAVCETYPRMDANGKRHFEIQYRDYREFLDRITGETEVVELEPEYVALTRPNGRPRGVRRCPKETEQE